jgi:hypothetical protein
VTLRMPYATFFYRITGHRIVEADDLSVLRSPRHELLELQACHPRFFATHRYVAYAVPVRVLPEHLRMQSRRSRAPERSSAAAGAHRFAELASLVRPPAAVARGRQDLRPHKEGAHHCGPEDEVGNRERRILHSSDIGSQAVVL